MDLFLYAGLLGILGVTGGFFAGLLGIGGGLIIVPGLYFLFSQLGYDGPYLMHLCVGTSLLTIAFTGSSSSYAHWKRGGVDFSLVRSIGTGVVTGVVFASLVASYLHSDQLKAIFVGVLFVLAGLMLFMPQSFIDKQSRPSFVVWSVGGVVNGFISTFVGIGGAALNVPFMSLFGVVISRAIGTAAAIGILVAIPGAIGFMLMDQAEQAVPPASIGFVNLMAVGFIVPLSMLVAPFGAMLTHKLPIKILRKGFAIFLCVVALQMLYEGGL